MNTMKFYRAKSGELLTLRIKIDQRVGLYAHGQTRGKSRHDACKLARSGGFSRTKAEALRKAA